MLGGKHRLGMEVTAFLLTPSKISGGVLLNIKEKD
jgi:hypothetical protein